MLALPPKKPVTLNVALGNRLTDRVAPAVSAQQFSKFQLAEAARLPLEPRIITGVTARSREGKGQADNRRLASPAAPERSVPVSAAGSYAGCYMA
jgi:hypothetical protein